MFFNGKRAVKWTIASLITFLLGGLLLMPAPAAQLDDTRGHWSEQMVCRAASLELINGYPDNSFKPEKELSQMEALVLFMRAAGYSDKKKTASKQAEQVSAKVPQVPWGQSYMDQAVENELLPDSWLATFNTGSPATRSQVAALIGRLLQLPISYNETDTSENAVFPDLNQASEEYIPCIIAISDAGIMNGYEDGTFRPQKILKRSEAAAILSSLIEQDWAKIPAGRRVEGWVQKITVQGNKSEMELLSLKAVQTIKLDSTTKFYKDNEECKPEEALNYRVEVLLNSKKQAGCISLLEKKAEVVPGDKIVGSVKSVVMGQDSVLVLSDLNTEERRIPIAWSAVLDDGGKGKTKGFNSLKAGTFVQAYVADGKLTKLSILAPKNISGTVQSITGKRLSLGGSNSKSSSSKSDKPEWFNYWDRARIVDKDGKAMGSVVRGDKVKVTYLDVFPGEIDDEIPLEIMISSRPVLKKVKAEVETTKSLEGKYGITVKKNKNYDVDNAVSVYQAVYSAATTFDFIKAGDKVEMEVDGAGFVMKINIL